VDAADYFSKLLSDSEVIIFDDCGHFISYEKTQETAKSIMEFLDLHSYDVID
jgi:pimeloyl-ACP methyl ester carboxylesterase